MKKSELRQIIREIILEDFKPETKYDVVKYKRNGYVVTSDKGNIKVYYGDNVVGTGDFDRDADGFFISFKSEHKSGQHGFDEYSEIVDYAIKHNIKR